MASFTFDSSRSTPQRIRQSREPVDHQSLSNQEEYRHLDNGQLTRFPNNPEGHDQRRCAGWQTTAIEKNHERAGRRERKSRCQDSWPENSRMLSEWNCPGAGGKECRMRVINNDTVNAL